MKVACSFLALLPAASGFVAPRVGRPRCCRQHGAMRMSLAKIELEAGKTSPFEDGFDPLELSSDKDFKTMKKWREAELKHGRVAMLSVVGAAVQENWHPLFGFDGKEMDGAIFHFQEIQNVSPFFWTLLLFFISMVEARSIAVGWEKGYGIGSTGIAGIREDYLTGNLGLDPLGIIREQNVDKFLEYRNKELNNGRLAMLAAAGIAVQEKFVTGGLPEFQITRFALSDVYN